MTTATVATRIPTVIHTVSNSQPGTMNTSQNPNTMVAMPAMLNNRRFVAPTFRNTPTRARLIFTAADCGHQRLDVDRTTHPDDDGNDVEEEDPVAHESP